MTSGQQEDGSRVALRVGIVGPGQIAQKAYFPVYLTLPGVQVVGVASRRRSTAEEAAHRFRLGLATDRLENLLRLQPDALFVHASTEAHAAVVRQALLAGVPVLCDKPLAPSAAETEELYLLAARRGVLLVTGFNRRFAPLYRRALSAVGGTEHLRLAVMEKHRPRPHPHPRVALWDDFIHVVDTLVFLGRLRGRVEPRFWLDAAGALAGVAVHEEGGEAVGLMYRNSGADRERLTVFGDGVTAEVGDLETLAVWREGREEREGFGSWEDVPARRGFRDMVHAFLSAVEEGGRRNPVPPEEALLTHRVVQGLCDRLPG